jgi:hypothetical protein
MKKSAYPLCRHTKTNGLLCQSPALIDSAFCYHHQKARRARRLTPGAGPGLSTSVLHPLRNAHTILQAVSVVLSGIASNQITLAKPAKCSTPSGSQPQTSAQPQPNHDLSRNPNPCIDLRIPTTR